MKTQPRIKYPKYNNSSSILVMNLWYSKAGCIAGSNQKEKTFNNFSCGGITCFRSPLF